MAGIKAKESPQIKKMRRKLEKQISAEKAKINPEKLEQIKGSILKWIERHSKERIDLKEKTITLFDENKHSAPIESKYVHQLFKNLQKADQGKQKPFKATEL